MYKKYVMNLNNVLLFKSKILTVCVALHLIIFNAMILIVLKKSKHEYVFKRNIKKENKNNLLHFLGF